MAGVGHVYQVLAFGDPVSDDSAGVRYGDVGALIKTNSPASPFTVANEAVATGLAQSLGLPVPAGGIVQAEDGELAWASWHFGPGGLRPPPIIPADAVADQPDLSGAVVAFDCWIANDDRHDRNLAYARDLVPFTMFDHGHALMGSTEQGRARLVEARNRPAEPGCLHPVIDDAMMIGALADEIAAVRGTLIERVCRAVQHAGALEEDLADRLIDFLDDRKRRIMDLLRSQSESIPMITEWSLA